MENGNNLYGLNDFDFFCNALKQRLKMPLPGSAAHFKMASEVRTKELSFGHDTSKAMPSSILILLYQNNNKTYTSLILRQTYDGVHSGQISFPGGRKEDDDKNLIDTALRESEEEVNINPKEVKVIGKLSELYIPPSNFNVLPVVGISKTIPDFKADKSEVAEIIQVQLDQFFNEGLKDEKIIEVRGHQIQAPYYNVDGHTIWGATAMIISEFTEVIKSITSANLQ